MSMCLTRRVKTSTNAVSKYRPIFRNEAQLIIIIIIIVVVVVVAI